MDSKNITTGYMQTFKEAVMESERVFMELPVLFGYLYTTLLSELRTQISKLLLIAIQVRPGLVSFSTRC